VNGSGPRRELIAALERELEALRAAGLERRTDPPPPGLVDFTSNDYLGFATHPVVVEGARRALLEQGAGSRAARLLGGGAAMAGAVEREVAAWLGAESALLFPSGYQANVGTIAALVGRGDHVFSDALNHASIIDGCRLSRAAVHVHRHADAADLEARLRAAPRGGRKLVVTESVFSMDGDRAPLAALLEVCARNGAVLIVDEAHAVGVLGPGGAGAIAELDELDEHGSDPAIGAALLGRIVTGGKALGCAGAFFVGPEPVRSILLQRARSFVFTTAPPPPLVGALSAAVELCRAADESRRRVIELATRVASALDLPAPAAAIVPLVLGDPVLALDAQAKCRAAGLDVRAVRPPTVPPDSSRLRVVLRATHEDADVDRLIDVLAELRPLLPTPRRATKSSAKAVFVAGTDTSVGKTVVSALLLAALRRNGPVRYWKPVQTGEESDTATVGRLAAATPDECLVPFHEFPLPASPHEAAAAAGARIDPAAIDRALESHLASVPFGCRVVVELAGGLLVPYVAVGSPADFDQIDWLESRGERGACELVLVARSGLGTLNHTRLALEALARRGLAPRLLLLVGEPHPANLETLRVLHPGLEIVAIPRLEPLDAAAIARVALGLGDSLPP
jgi:8-amino-7-oxononanoate synthase